MWYRCTLSSFRLTVPVGHHYSGVGDSGTRHSGYSAAIGSGHDTMPAVPNCGPLGPAVPEPRANQHLRLLHGCQLTLLLSAPVTY
jgi:hypothetical protein